MEPTRSDTSDPADLTFFIPGPSSRFFPSVREYLQQRGLPVEAQGRRLRQSLPGLEVIMARGFDIPSFIADGWGHIGLTGVDAVQESGREVEILAHLGIRYSEVVFASATRKRLQDLSNGDLIINEYPSLGRRFFESKGVWGLRFREVTGAAESLAQHEEVAGMVTLKTSGSSLRDNGLEVVEVILKTHACLIAPLDRGDRPQAVADLVSTLANRDDDLPLGTTLPTLRLPDGAFTELT